MIPVHHVCTLLRAAGPMDTALVAFAETSSHGINMRRSQRRWVFSGECARWPRAWNPGQSFRRQRSAGRERVRDFDEPDDIGIEVVELLGGDPVFRVNCASDLLHRIV